MSTDSAARKAAKEFMGRTRELWKRWRNRQVVAGYWSEDQIIEFAAFVASDVHTTAAACQTVAPPDVDQIAKRYWRDANVRTITEAILIKIAREAYALGAAPAVSTPRCPKCKSHRIEVHYGLYVPDGKVSPDQAICRECLHGTGAAQTLADFAQFFHPAPSPPRLELLEKAAAFLEMMYDKWENGDPSFSESGDSLGNAFQLGSHEDQIIDVLDKLFPVASPQGESK